MDRIHRTIQEAVALAQRNGTVFLVTADDTGLPHIAIIDSLIVNGADSVTVSGWDNTEIFCDLWENKNLTVVVCGNNRYYQLYGELKKSESSPSEIVDNDDGSFEYEDRLTIRIHNVSDIAGYATAFKNKCQLVS